MEKEDKIKFIRWVLSSDRFTVWHPEIVRNDICLQPKDGKGDCVRIWWNTKPFLDVVTVQLWKGFEVNDFDFGTEYDGVGFVDCFRIDYDSVEREIDHLKTMATKQMESEAAKRRDALYKHGDASNFMKQMLNEF